MNGTMIDGFSLARASLVEAMRALHSISNDGFIVVGAQAVYLRTAALRTTVPPFTLDGDIVADPRLVRRPRFILQTLENAGFTLRGHSGLYHRAATPIELRRGTEIDIFVPGRFDNYWELEGFNRADATAVMKQDGLELALFDKSTMDLTSEDGTSGIPVLVAGILALTVAKGWKIGERFEQGSDEFAKIDKDVLDTYRLLAASSPNELAKAMQQLPKEPHIVDVAEKGISYLRKLCVESDYALDLLENYLTDPHEIRLVRASVRSLVAELSDLFRASF
jgi:hypothetical protein